MDADANTTLKAAVDHLYELGSVESIDQSVLPGLAELGYVVDGRRDRELTLLGLRRPRWAIALAVFLFPVGLLALLFKRPRELRLEWNAGETVMLGLTGDDPAAAHAIASVAFEHEQPPGLIETAAVPFAAGGASVLFGWLAAVQLTDSKPAFIVAVFVSALIGCGVGTMIAMHRASHAEDPRSPVRWGTLPALVGCAAMTALFVGLVAFLLAVGAGG
jgi:disulfide bond formation protein DsbB